MDVTLLLVAYGFTVFIMMFIVIVILLILLSHGNGSVRVNPKVWERKMRTKQKLKGNPPWKRKL